MNTYRKLALSLTLLFAVTSQVNAKDTMEKRQGPPSFESLDTNSDGGINFEEFSSHKIPHGDPQTIFNTIDTDGSGVISSEEFSDHKPPQRNRR